MAYTDNVKNTRSTKFMQDMIKASDNYLDRFLAVNKNMPPKLTKLFVAARKGDDVALEQLVKLRERIVKAKTKTVNLDARYEKSNERFRGNYLVNEKFKRLHVAPGSYPPNKVPLWGAETEGLEPHVDDDGNPTGKSYDVVVEDDGTPACDNEIDPVSYAPLTEHSVIRRKVGQSKQCIGLSMMDQVADDAERRHAEVLWPLTRERIVDYSAPAQLNAIEEAAWRRFNLVLVGTSLSSALGLLTVVFAMQIEDVRNIFAALCRGPEAFSSNAHHVIALCHVIIFVFGSAILGDALLSLLSRTQNAHDELEALRRRAIDINGEDTITITNWAMRQLRRMFS